MIRAEEVSEEEISSKQISDWTTRVLSRGTLGIHPQKDWPQEDWKLQAYAQYKAKLNAADYPCFFGQTAELRGEMLYTFATHDTLPEMTANMREFVRLLATPQHARFSLTAFFAPEPALTTHEAFLNRFWQTLQFLHEHDTHPATARTPDHPLWEFSFEGCEMFVVGTSPTYRQRRSRNLGPGIVLIFQPRVLFIDPATSAPIAAEVRHRIHKRMLAYDNMPVHPDIGFYGQPTNREWKQYALPDDNSPEQGHCPFHTRST